MESMTSAELTRLIDWLKSKGMTDADVLDCLKFIGR